MFSVCGSAKFQSRTSPFITLQRWAAKISIIERCCPTCQSPGSAIAPQSELHWHADETSSSLELVEENEGWKLNVMKFAGAECEGSERE
jgi:hypothetical protein